MDEICEIFSKTVQFTNELEEISNECHRRLHAILYGQSGEEQGMPLKDRSNITPKQEKKRPKRLTSLQENDENIAAIDDVLNSNNSIGLNVINQDEQKVSSIRRSPRSSTKNSQKGKGGTTVTKAGENIHKTESLLMPPPIAPGAVTSSISDQSYSRPQRAAKLNCEKNLKEPNIKGKLRRPSNDELSGVKIKVEREQRASQMSSTTTTSKCVDSTASTVSDNSVIAIPTKKPSIVCLASDTSSSTSAKDGSMSENTSQSVEVELVKNVRVRIKREKLSITSDQTKICVEAESNGQKPKETEPTIVESSIALTTTEINIKQSKKNGGKKKVVPKPIKVERFSDVDENKTECSVASRTRRHNKLVENDKEPVDLEPNLSNDQKTAPTVYEEVKENLPPSKERSRAMKTVTPNSSGVLNEIVASAKQDVTPSNNIDSTIVLGSAPNDATYCTANQATFVLDTQNCQPVQGDVGCDLTFNVASEKPTASPSSSTHSMVTAQDTLRQNSIMTEDDSYECPEAQVPITKKSPQVPLPKHATAVKPSATKTMPTSSKTCKMPARTIEIFNPLVQSPVKKKVEAYENVAAAQAVSTGTTKRTNSKQTKESGFGLLQGSSTTPLIGKLPAQTLGRFLTPNQSSNTIVTPNVMAQTKKIPASASKAQTLTKSNSAVNLKAGASSVKGLSRENSAEEFRKGLHQLAEERKKQREQKHLLAAQQREAKERERAERMAKVAKEREEKRLRKQLEAEEKKRELEEIQRKLRAQEILAAAEVTKQKAKIHAEQEKALSQQMQAPSSHGAIPKVRMQPQKTKIQNKYTFEMLHMDDSTDDESKTTYKRPPPPTWSRRNVRGPSIVVQQEMPTAVVDSFFSVQPMTPDLKVIFPAIDPRYLKRNSSVLWSTPPRYSELPKY